MCGLACSAMCRMRTTDAFIRFTSFFVSISTALHTWHGANRPGSRFYFKNRCHACHAAIWCPCSGVELSKCISLARKVVMLQFWAQLQFGVMRRHARDLKVMLDISRPQFVRNSYILPTRKVEDLHPWIHRLDAGSSTFLVSKVKYTNFKRIEIRKSPAWHDTELTLC